MALVYYYFGISTAVLIIYNSSTFFLWWEMRNCHKMAFKLHFWPNLVLFLITEVTFLNYLISQILIILRFICNHSENQLDELYAGYCPRTDLSSFTEHFTFVNINNNMNYLLPIIAFLLCNKPHDCYTCLGKDPDRNYSIYQLSQEERTKRKFRSKFSRTQEQELVEQKKDFYSVLQQQRYNARRNTSIKFDALPTLKRVNTKDERLIMDEMVDEFAGAVDDFADSLDSLSPSNAELTMTKSASI